MYCLEPIRADKTFNTCLKGRPRILVVQRNLKIKLSPGTVLLVVVAGALSNLYSLTEKSQQHQTRMGKILKNLSGST